MPVQRPLNEAPAAGLPDKLTMVDQRHTTEEHRLWCTLNLHAFVEGVVNLMVQGRLAQGMAPLWIPDHEIGVTANGDRTLLGVETEDLCRRSRRELDKAVQTEVPLDNTLVESDHALFNTRRSIGDERKVITPQIFLAPKVEATVVGANGLEAPICQGRPEQCLLTAGPWGWREDILGTVKIGAIEILFTRVEVVRACFSKDAYTTSPSTFDLLQRLGTADVNHKEIGANSLGQGSCTCYGLRLHPWWTAQGVGARCTLASGK